MTIVNDIEVIGPGKYAVISRSTPGLWHYVTDGVCDCKGYQHRQKCRHLDKLIQTGWLSPEMVEGYYRNQKYPPLRMADPRVDTKYAIWTAGYRDPYLRVYFRNFFRVGITPKPNEPLDYGLDAYFESIHPEEWMWTLWTDNPDDFARAYRQQLEALGPDKIATYLGNAKTVAGTGKSVVLLGWPDDVSDDTGFVNPRRVFVTWWYERTKQVIPEIQKGIMSVTNI